MKGNCYSLRSINEFSSCTDFRIFPFIPVFVKIANVNAHAHTLSHVSETTPVENFRTIVTVIREPWLQQVYLKWKKGIESSILVI